MIMITTILIIITIIIIIITILVDDVGILETLVSFPSPFDRVCRPCHPTGHHIGRYHRHSGRGHG
jgi:hypothetical protein